MFDMEDNGNEIILRMKSNLDVSVELSAELLKLADAKEFVLDFSEAEHFSSSYPRLTPHSWIGDVMRFKKKVEELGGSVRWINLNASVEESFLYFNLV